MSYTPGPWTAVGPVGFIFTDGSPYGHGQMHVAQVRGWGHLTGKGGGCAFDEDKAVAIQEANARLIAAAPTMYHELELAANTFRDFSNVLRVLGKDVMAAAADVAERHIREQLAAIQKAETG